MEEIVDNFTKNLLNTQEAILSFRDAYEILIKIYKRYIYLDEKLYPLVACWILGNYFHKIFPSFPYLYLNAPKQSGKSRFLKLSAFLTNGTYTVNITEAVLFRTSTPLFVDEVETITRKEKAGLRELLNVAYKKGGVVQRARKIEKTGETRIENFEVYRPIALANIEGMDEVLEDRCITINLERCFDPVITRRLELFDFDDDIRKFKEAMSSSDVSVCVVKEENIKEVLVSLFNYYNKTTQTTPITSITSPNETTPMTLDNKISETAQLIIDKIEKTTLQGRDLELFLPLFIIAGHIGEDVLDSLIQIAVEMAEKRKEQNLVENRDIALIGFLAGYCKAFNLTSSDFIPLTELVKKYREINPDDEWFNTKWLGNALKRAGKIVLEKRRMSKGREVRLNIDLIFEKAAKFGFDIDKLAESLKTEENLSSFSNERRWF